MGWQQPAKPVPAQLRLTQVIAARPLLMYLMIQRHLRLLMCLPPTSQHVVASLLDTGLDKKPVDLMLCNARGRQQVFKSLYHYNMSTRTVLSLLLFMFRTELLPIQQMANCKVRSMYRSPLSTERDTFYIDYMQVKAASREQACARQRGDRHTSKIATAQETAIYHGFDQVMGAHGSPTAACRLEALRSNLFQQLFPPAALLQVLCQHEVVHLVVAAGPSLC